MMNGTPAVTERTLRCANGMLYLMMGLGAAACAAWAIGSGRVHELWHIVAAVAGVLVCVVWGWYYASLRWEVGPSGICRRVWWVRRSYAWQDLAEAQLSESEARGVGSCCITLCFSGGERVRLSSELLALDEVEALRDELSAAGVFCARCGE